MATNIVPQSLQLEVGAALLEEGMLPPPPPQAARNKARVKPQLRNAARNPEVNIRVPHGVIGTEAENAGVARRLT
jgi:hypothetical protein